MIKLFSILCGILISLGVSAGVLPPEFTASYEIKKGFIRIGEATRTLRKENDYWVYISDSKTSGFVGSLVSEHIVQTTRFIMVDGIIRPLSYHYNRNNGKKIVTQSYDWNKHQVTSQRGDTIDVYDIPDKVQDQSIYQLSLMMDFAEKPQDMIYHIAENVRLVDYLVKYTGQQLIKIRLGNFEAHTAEVKTKKGKTQIWTESSLHFLPIKIDYEQDGTSFTAWLKQIEGF